VKGIAMVKRFCSALIIIPLVALALRFGPPYTIFIMVAITVVLGMYEFYAMTLPRDWTAGKISGIALGVILCGLYQWATADIILLFFVFIIGAFLFGYAVSSRELPLLPSRMGIILFGILYIPFLLSYLILISKIPQGILWIFLLFATVWVGDTFAFLIGSWWGRHKLSPLISPHKTIEGFFACFVGSILTVFACRAVFLLPIPTLDALLVAVGIALFGQWGDLSESMIKRGAKVKDSGALIPGHGGMLDRLDSFFFSTPFLYYYLLYRLAIGAL
jgi:phosphatidate cytidylyltransferase